MYRIGARASYALGKHKRDRARTRSGEPASALRSVAGDMYTAKGALVFKFSPVSEILPLTFSRQINSWPSMTFTKAPSVPS